MTVTEADATKMLVAAAAEVALKAYVMFKVGNGATMSGVVETLPGAETGTTVLVEMLAGTEAGATKAEEVVLLQGAEVERLTVTGAAVEMLLLVVVLT